MSLKDLGYKPRRESERIILDDSLRREWEAARSAYAAQQRVERAPDQGLGSELPAYQKKLEDAETAASEAAVTFVCEALPRHELAALIESCPPTSDQLERWKEEDKNNPLLLIDPPAWDYEKFAPRLIAASLVEPEATEEEVVEMWETGAWSDSIWSALWKLAWDKTNKRVTTLPTSGIGSERTQVSDPVSPTP